MGVKISALPTATEAEAASGLIPVVTDPNGDGNLVTKHITGSSIVGSGASVNTSATPPSNPSNGDLWFDEDNAELYIYNTSINGWIQTNGGGGSGGGAASGGLIDHVEVRSSCSGPGRNSYCQYTWPDWDADTQIVLCMGAAGREVPISSNIHGGLSIGSQGKVWMYPDASDPTKGNGIMQVQDDISGSGDVGAYFWRLYRAPGTHHGTIE